MKYRNYLKFEGDFIGFRIEDYVSENHLVRFLDMFVDKFDLTSFERKEVKCGNKPYDIRLMLKILLLGYISKITSTRRLENACRENIMFMYLCRNNFPKYRSIGIFRKEHYDVILDLFVAFLNFLEEEGIVKFSHVIVDKTTIAGQGSKEKLLRQERLKELREDVVKWFEETAANDLEEEREEIPEGVKEEIEKKFGRLSRDIEKTVSAVREMMKKELTSICVTEPESRLIKKSGSKGFELGYGVQTAATPEGFVVAVDVVQTSTDDKELAPLVEKVEENTGEKVEKVDADSGYYNSKMIEELELRGVDTCVPSPEYIKETREGSREITASELGYDEERDIYVCPGGQEFVYEKEVVGKEIGKTRKLYRFRGSCENCGEKTRCKLFNSGEGKTIRMSPQRPQILKNKEKFKKEEYKERYKKRKTIIERNFGYMKHNKGFRKFTLKGKQGATIESYLLFLGLNIVLYINKKYGELQSRNRGIILRRKRLW